MRTRAFTRRDLIAVLGVMVVLASVALVVMPVQRRRAAEPMEATQLRGIHQGMIAWCQSCNDEYPLPSRLDKLNSTVANEGRSKDTTANIYSILVFNGAVSPELLVSPLETNGSIVSCDDYEYQSPSRAVDPAHACWDPKFSAALDGSVRGNVSFAHLQPSDGRFAKYANTFRETEMILGTRTPEIAHVVKNADGSVTPTFANPSSNALRFYGRRQSWSGHLAFNDDHVEFLPDRLANGRRLAGGNRYQDGTGKSWPDLWCYDEPDDPTGHNDFLGIFLKAGERPSDFQAAWD